MVTASMEVTSDFPTPPLPLTTPITLLMLLISCGFTEKSFFFSFLSAQSSEQLLQLWLQFSLIISAPSCIFFMHGCYALITLVFGKHNKQCKNNPQYKC